MMKTEYHPKVRWPNHSLTWHHLQNNVYRCARLSHLRQIRGAQINILSLCWAHAFLTWQDSEPVFCKYCIVLFIVPLRNDALSMFYCNYCARKEGCMNLLGREEDVTWVIPIQPSKRKWEAWLQYLGTARRVEKEVTTCVHIYSLLSPEILS